jgi:excinuclease ABC subunit C
LPFVLNDSELIEQYLELNLGVKTHIMAPQRGDKVRLVELANKNAIEEVERITTKEDKFNGVSKLLSKMLSIDSLHRIEAYDISNISGTDTVGSMVVFIDGKPAKRHYKKYKIDDTDGQDDYGSMRQMLLRRANHYIAKDVGFDDAPDLVLIDGGINHAATVRELLRALGLLWPVYGMVKDDRHRTRALVTPDGYQISIDTNQSVFSFIGSIQEETHRFAITYHKSLRSKRLRYSELDQISGIGTKRKQELLRVFKSITAIRAASLLELERILPKPIAQNVYDYFNSEKE